VARRPSRAVLGALAIVLVVIAGPWVESRAQVRLLDESDRAAFRAWFVLLADAQYYQPFRDVTDCAALVRAAVREALRPHSPEWRRQVGLAFAPQYSDVRRRPKVDGAMWPLFRVADDPDAPLAEFADARTLIRYNARPLGRRLDALTPGDLLYFHQERQSQPDHLMVYLGASLYEPVGRDWVVYHTGPDAEAGTGGEVRKVRLADLVRHPSPRWRPLAANNAFIGAYRLAIVE
jgi:uncharacterized protein YfaT (DUF1175 family)